ncbi:MAG TPA: polyprenyl synthetase family protein [Saprospiraceae bacterium]|nr:polyprenyl synthetase family protein [Saprospiraceae bacterium]
MNTQKEIQELFNTYCKNHSFKGSPQELYDPINYILGLGGKRLRPVLMLLSAQLFGDAMAKVLPAAFAIEVFHNFSLVHDDIMDNAFLRRGKEATHIKYSTSAGILSGDVMLIYAYQYLSSYNNIELLNIFNQLAIDVCEGQQYDMNFETQEHVSLDAYMKMIELKTAALIAGAMKIGAMIGGANEEEANNVYEFGRNIGIAFQLQDDILDSFGDAKKFGKKIGGDIIQNKKTYLILKSLEIAPEDKRLELEKWMKNNTSDEQTKIKSVTKIFRDLAIEVHAHQAKEKYLQLAIESINKINCAETRKGILKSIAIGLANRDN